MSLVRLRLPILAAALLAAAGAHAATLLSEGFDDVATLAGSGWLSVNLDPDPALTVDWFQGQSNIFESHSGALDSYIASNYSAAAPGTTLENWLITPEFSTEQAGTVTFWLRGAADVGYVDTVRVGFSDGSTDTTQFLLGTAIVATGGWTEYTISYAAGGTGSTARFAIEHTGLEDLSDYVGVDDVSVNTAATGVVPEPAGWATLAAGLLGLAALRRRGTR
jgi:hypothetical protein